MSAAFGAALALLIYWRTLWGGSSHSIQTSSSFALRTGATVTQSAICCSVLRENLDPRLFCSPVSSVSVYYRTTASALSGCILVAYQVTYNRFAALSQPIQREAAYLHSLENSQGSESVTESEAELTALIFLPLSGNVNCLLQCVLTTPAMKKVAVLSFLQFLHHTVCCQRQPALRESAKAT